MRRHLAVLTRALVSIPSCAMIAFVSLLLLLPVVVGQEPVDRERLVWSDQARLRMEGDQIVMVFRGEVFLPDGSPAPSIRVRSNRDSPLDVHVGGNRFQFEAPRNLHGHQSGISVLVSSADGNLMASRMIYDYACRAEANRVIKITLRKTRSISVRVEHKGEAVTDAQVHVEGASYGDFVGHTDDRGVFTTRVPDNYAATRITAWTNEPKRIGGYSMSRRAPLDPRADQYVVKLSDCRPQKVRLIETDDQPIADVGVRFGVSISAEDNFVPRPGKDRFITDKNGEFVDRWFPVDDKFRVYVNLIKDDKWFKSAVDKIEDGVVVTTLSKSKSLQRKRVEGQIRLPRNLSGGFRVRLGSFQHPQKGRYDPIVVRSDLEGKFSADVMPGATYCLCVDDSQWVSNFWTGVLYDPESGQMQNPVLQLSKGERIEIELTSGPNRDPIPDTTVSLSSSHDFQWQEGDDTQHGSLGRQWWVITDREGKAITRAVAGELESYVTLPDWRPNVTVSVQPRLTKTISFHRESPEKRTVNGRVQIDDKLQAQLAGALVQVFAMDEGTVGSARAEADRDGRFSVDIAGARLGGYVKSADGKAAGQFAAEKPEQGMQCVLVPTTTYRGQLVDQKDQPLPGRWVRLSAQIEDKDARWQNTAFVRTSFVVDEMEVITDENGKFEFKHVPQTVELRLEAQNTPESNAKSSGRERGHSLGTKTLKPGVDRVREIFRVPTK